MRFTGWASAEDVPRHVSNMDIFFNPSLAAETFALVNIEAMAAGTPVACFGVGGMLEYIIPDVNSVVLDRPEPRAAARDIAALLEQPERLAELGSRARESVLENFRAESSVRRWATLYDSLVVER